MPDSSVKCPQFVAEFLLEWRDFAETLPSSERWLMTAWITCTLQEIARDAAELEAEVASGWRQ